MKHPCHGKRRYGSYDAAALVVVNAKIQRSLHGQGNRREERVYWCGDCVGFHVTSLPADDRRRAS